MRSKKRKKAQSKGGSAEFWKPLVATIISILGIVAIFGALILFASYYVTDFKTNPLGVLVILSVTGMAGGILYSINLNKKIELLSWGENGKSINPGILDDVLIGITGAFVAYALFGGEFFGLGDSSQSRLEVTLRLLDNAIQNGLQNADQSTLNTIRQSLKPLSETEKAQENLTYAISLFTLGLVGGYGGKALIEQVLGKIGNKLTNLEKDKEEEKKKKEQLYQELGKLDQEKAALQEGGTVIDLVNQHIVDGISDQAQRNDLVKRIEKAPPDVKNRVFTIAKEIRRAAWKSRSPETKKKISRTILIFSALVNSSPNNPEYRFQLAISYKESEQPDYNKAIDEIEQAIKLRTSDNSDTTWKYEMVRALCYIAKLTNERDGDTADPETREKILSDLMVVERHYGLIKLLKEADDNVVDSLIYDWFQDNRTWLESDKKGKVLLKKIEQAPPTKTRAIKSVSVTGSSVTTPVILTPTVSGKPDRWDIALANAPTTGASARTAGQDRLPQGIASSKKMAENDWPRIKPFIDRFYPVAVKFDLPPALIAAIASRESRAGAALTAGGLGDHGNAFGIMQVDKRYHKQAGKGGDPASQAHLEQGAKILADYRQQLINKHRNWEDTYILKGAVAAYNSGVSNIQTKQGIDRGTTGDDYGSDVIARAHFYAERMKSLGECKSGVSVSSNGAKSGLQIILPKNLEVIKDVLDDVDQSVDISRWDEDLMGAVQAALINLKLLSGPADAATVQRVWARFKKKNYQSDPSTIGPGSAQLLLDALGAPHPVNSEQSESSPANINDNAGKRTGKRKTLPGYNKVVYQNEYIVPGVPLTWGECTKGMSDERWPTQKAEVDNAIRLAKAFGEVRRRYGKPLRITSGFRPPAVNRRIGGATRSQHILFKALDIQPLDGNFAPLLKAVRATPSVKGVGLGQHRGFIHMDIRDGNRVEFPY